jgi:selenocysteine lyase/cysteine desulfurase
VIPFTLNEKDNGLVGEWIDERYGIFCRVGLHCAPAAARTMGVFPDGTIRFSLGYFNQLSEINYALEALRALSER